MEESDVWVIMSFYKLVIDYEIVVGSYSLMAHIIEMQRKQIGVSENTFLVNWECYLLGLL
jgi:hypothetical protein